MKSDSRKNFLFFFGGEKGNYERKKPWQNNYICSFFETKFFRFKTDLVAIETELALLF